MGPLRGHKGNPVYEGGQRTAFLIRWPGSIPAGKTSNEIGISSDLLPTFAKLCGGKLSENKIDGQDISQLFLNPEKAKSPHEGVANKGQAYRLGKWKMAGNQLFDLEKDIGEKTNVASDHPEVLKKLSARNKEWVAMMQREARPHAKMPDPSPLIMEKEANALPRLEDWLKKES